MSTHRSRRKPWWIRHIKALILFAISLFLVGTGITVIWFSTLQIPDLSAFEARKVAQSTQIYDRTGEIVLYDVHGDTKRKIVPFSEISEHIKHATIAVEDNDFYNHRGIQPSSIVRAFLADIKGGELTQGGSTITQQVIKNSVLTKDKTITRKLKEWILAIKIEKVLTKDEIFETYLNESPYGGTIYGVELASKAFFGKSAKDVTIAESAYLAAVPQAPTFYSPYGKNRDKLDARQKMILEKMKEQGYINEEEYASALEEKVEFLAKNTSGIRAPHFSIYVREYLIEKYGQEMVDEGGLKVTTSLDYRMQEKAEEVIGRFAPTLASQFNASNTAMIAINPKNGDILVMVGSRDYFDEEIEGNFNVSTAHRQPGSTFKPFVYATAFMRGYTPETVLFDVPTEFSTQCTVDGKPKRAGQDPKTCYSPEEYDGLYEGPLTIREALAHSRNIPAVKALYLSGIKESLATARAMGITSLTTPDRYGLTLVLGGGEVSLLELTSAYGVFANDGIRNPYRSVLKVEDSNGNILEEAKDFPSQAIFPQAARQINDILSDTKVRMSSLVPIGEALGGKQVAIKTGTTNDFKDVWIAGYTPNIAVAAWAGKNDNTSMGKKVAGLIISPLWGAFMSEINEYIPNDYFKKPEPPPPDSKPVLRGIWRGGISYNIDTISQKVATEYTPQETKQEIILNGVHSILQWVNKDDPTGPSPRNPAEDSQYEYWEYGVRNWFNNWRLSNPNFLEASSFDIPTVMDDVHTSSSSLTVSITSPASDTWVNPQAKVNINLVVSGQYPIKKAELYVNGRYIYTNELNPETLSFIPQEAGVIQGKNIIKAIVYDSVFNKSEVAIDLIISD
ncbi:MAG: penicillin-binding protein [bacterium]|nr:penicillin-binding protein [bacterium]